ncbi:hypothetical protein EV368DRAFT_90222 [Lentinula lateritia]|nr:hypothetical protein EV368DRAFT_90222 [Lentinula lateritia]
MSFQSLVATPVAPFELQPAPSILQHKLPIPTSAIRPILTQMLHYPYMVSQSVGDGVTKRGDGAE